MQVLTTCSELYLIGSQFSLFPQVPLQALSITVDNSIIYGKIINNLESSVKPQFLLLNLTYKAGVFSNYIKDF